MRDRKCQTGGGEWDKGVEFKGVLSRILHFNSDQKDEDELDPFALTKSSLSLNSISRNACYHGIVCREPGKACFCTTQCLVLLFVSHLVHHPAQQVADDGETFAE